MNVVVNPARTPRRWRRGQAAAQGGYTACLEREGKVFASPAEAAEAERRATWALTVAERMEIARVLRERVYGVSPPDVRASHPRAGNR